MAEKYTMVRQQKHERLPSPCSALRTRSSHKHRGVPLEDSFLIVAVREPGSNLESERRKVSHEPLPVCPTVLSRSYGAADCTRSEMQWCLESDHDCMDCRFDVAVRRVYVQRPRWKAVLEFRHPPLELACCGSVFFGPVFWEDGKRSGTYLVPWL